MLFGAGLTFEICAAKVSLLRFDIAVDNWSIRTELQSYSMISMKCTHDK